ncbi:MAG: rubrerythrin [Clostridiales bacterium]|nr:rubrerythrin [Clostridiales bacterium]
MDDKHGIRIAARDRVMRAWECSMELVRDFRAYAGELKDNEKLSTLFSEYAEAEAVHAAELLKILQSYEKDVRLA